MTGRIRITGGRLRGRFLPVEPGVRPTEGQVREALFSIWQTRLEGALFLDLFAGSGVMGMEALSRGAHRVTFVEEKARVLRSLRGAVETMGEADETRWIRARIPEELKAVERTEPEGFDLIFADPPYAYPLYESLVGAAGKLLRDEGELAVEHSVRKCIEPDPGSEVEVVDRREYGETFLSFFVRSG
ncbi:MAG: 16S rRNA (guanine(966)-N(2))-methyltransferase RsmD [Thermoanaerobaculia bacterium]|nr:16S rRNA (guanine(966)-N(2))-methyltransferase RsmD [Thermoanaerobaculia bacterium]